MTVVSVVEVAMYLLGASGIGLALAGIYSVCRAFARKQDRLYQQRYEEFVQRKALSRHG